jgi:hypothetical protein
MPASPWRTFGSPDPNGDFVALLSYLPLKSYWRVFPFVFYTACVMSLAFVSTMELSGPVSVNRITAGSPNPTRMLPRHQMARMDEG